MYVFLRQCVSCPKYTLPDYNLSSITVAPSIKFHQYIMFSTCSIQRLIGKVRLRYNLCETEKPEDKIGSRNILTLKELAIGIFVYDV